jgi:hypothetical protein
LKSPYKSPYKFQKFQNFKFQLPPYPTGREPPFAIDCRRECTLLSRRMPWLFHKQRKETLPASIISRFVQHSRAVEEESRFGGPVGGSLGAGGLFLDLSSSAALARRRQHHSLPIQLSIHHRDGSSTRGGGEVGVEGAVSSRKSTLGFGRKRKSTAVGPRGLAGVLEGPEEADESAYPHYEELPLTIATPAKRQRLMLFPVTPVAARRRQTISTPVPMAGQAGAGSTSGSKG